RGARLGVAPALVDMEIVDAIKHRLIEVVKPPESFDGGTVSLLDGTQVQVDVVICSTGYRRGLGPPGGHLGVLNQPGVPVATTGEAVADGLRFLGFLARPSQFGYAAKRSRRMAKEIANSLR